MANKQPEPFVNSSLLPLGPDKTIYRKISSDGVTTEKTNLGTFLRVEKSAITTLTEHAMRDIAHLLRTEHLQQLAEILKDPQASANDRFVALDLLKNASISAGGVLPMCQDTGTAIVKGSKGQFVFTGGGDEEAIAKGIYNTYQTSNLRYSQLAPITMFEEVNTNTNLPAEIKISATDGDEFKFLFIAKGGGSANKSYLFQETKALLNEKVLLPWLFDKMQTLGTSACPPYHLAVVIPAAPHLLSAPDVRNGVHEAAIEQGQPHGAERRFHSVAVRAVRIQQQRPLGVAHQRLLVHEGERHHHTIARGRHKPFHGVQRGIVPAEHFVALEQHTLARAHVVVVDGVRRHQR
ncbi:MAG: hypothetical protein EBV51_03340 [Acidimicrobiia bacterium]|nr:hypothetical protein [Acidimicrobiia bacterium]